MELLQTAQVEYVVELIDRCSLMATLWPWSDHQGKRAFANLNLVRDLSQLALGNQRAHLLSTVLWCIRLWTTKGARSNYPITYYVTSDSAFND